jgi:hypothetical protein
LRAPEFRSRVPFHAKPRRREVRKENVQTDFWHVPFSTGESAYRTCSDEEFIQEKKLGRRKRLPTGFGELLIQTRIVAASLLAEHLELAAPVFQIPIHLVLVRGIKGEVAKNLFES